MGPEPNPPLHPAFPKVLAAGPKPVSQVKPSSARNAAPTASSAGRAPQSQGAQKDEWTFDPAEVELLLNMSPRKVYFMPKEISHHITENWGTGDNASH